MTITLKKVAIGVVSALVFALAFASFTPLTHALTQSDVDLICIIVDCDSAGIRDALEALVDDEGTEITRDLFRGISGDDVTALQEFLAEDPTIYPEGLVTGFYGPLTEKAVQKFQKKFGISDTGYVGSITKGTLNKLLKKGKKIKDVTVVDDENVTDDAQAVGGGKEKVVVCHKGQTITVGAPAVQAHVRNHGDELGACEGGDVPDDNDDDDVATSTLTLLKEVVKDNDGTAVDTDWTLEFSGPDSGSGIEGDDAITDAVVEAGDYDLSESGGPDGYTASDWDCGDATMVDSDTVTVGVGEDVVCTITNDDDAPTE